MKSKRLQNIVFILCTLMIILISATLCIAFLMVKDVQVELDSGKYVIAHVGENNQIGVYQKMKQDEQKIIEKLKNEGISANVISSLNPNLSTYRFYEKSKVIEPIDLRIVDKEFLHNIDINDVKKDTLYTLDGELHGAVGIRVNIGEYKNDFYKSDYKVYNVEAKSSIAKDTLPTLVPQDQYLSFGNYITVETFESLLKEVYGESLDTFSLDTGATYDILIKSNSAEESNKVQAILKDEYALVVSIDDEENTTFKLWNMLLRYGGGMLIILIILEFILIRNRRKKNSI